MRSNKKVGRGRKALTGQMRGAHLVDEWFKMTVCKGGGNKIKEVIKNV